MSVKVVELKRQVYAMNLNIEAKSALILQRFWRNTFFKLQRGRATVQICKWVYYIVLPSQRKLKFKRGVSGFQKLWRGHKLRCSMYTKKVVRMRRRIQEANRQARENPHLRLGVKTSAALKTLKESTRLSTVLRACLSLELSTTYSKRCCEAFLNSDAPSVLFNFIRSCNRSAPHLELLKHALTTLINVTKWKNVIVSGRDASPVNCPLISLPSFSNIESKNQEEYDSLPCMMRTEQDVDLLVDLLQMYRDKESIFISASILLIHLAHGDSFAKEALVASETACRRLKSITKILKRKLKMERLTSTRKKPQHGIDTNLAMSAALEGLEGVIQGLW